MGTWGLGTFEDDVACDWLEDLFESDAILFFRQCLDLTGHLDDDGRCDLDHVSCVGIVCTAETILGLVDRPREGLPDAVVQWIHANDELPVDSMVTAAISGLSHVLAEGSQMRGLWEDSDGQYDPWRRGLLELISRLNAVQPPNP